MGNNTPSYFLDLNFGDFFYGVDHPMKPIRINMVHDLIFSYGLHEHLQTDHSSKVTKKAILNFHENTYLASFFKEKKRCQKSLIKISKIFEEDCPVFSGIAAYCQIYSGGSISGARNLNKGKNSIAINWSGGLHHAKRKESSGFCYVNDIILSILELLKNFKKVLYIDIDIHHGDGVEEAFYLSKRVFCLSFHKFSKNFFPGTGSHKNSGIGIGKKFTLNIPLRNPIQDKTFRYIFEPIVSTVITKFHPDVIVIQAGADSLEGDKLGSFDLTIFGHSHCIEFIKNFKIPLLVLGGGGYLKTNVARCWGLETSILTNTTISQFLPYNNFWRLFSPSFKLPHFLGKKQKEFSKKNFKIKKQKNLNNFKKIFFPWKSG